MSTKENDQDVIAESDAKEDFYASEVDSSMFNESELAEINSGIEKFLTQRKEQEGTIDQNRLRIKPRKRVFVVPMVILVLSIVSLIFVLNFYRQVASAESDSWITQFFGVRTSAGGVTEVSDATRELILEIRDENEARLVELFVDLINEDNEVVAAPEDQAEESETTQVDDVEDSAAALDDAAAALDDAAAASNNDAVESALQAEIIALQEQLSDQSATSDNLALLQEDFTALSGRYDQASLQNDQYVSLVNTVYTNLFDENYSEASRVVDQLEEFLLLIMADSNPLLRDISSTGDTFVRSARLYIGKSNELDEAIARLEETNAEIAEIRQSAEDAIQSSIAESSAISESEIADLREQNVQFQTENQQFRVENERMNAEVSELRRQTEQLLSEIRRVREAAN